MADLLRHLIDNGLLTSQQAGVVQRRQQRTGQSTEQALLDLKYCSSRDIYKAIGACSGIKFTELEPQSIPSNAAKLLPSRIALQFHCVPAGVNNGILQIAFNKNPDESTTNQLRLLGVHFEPILATPEAIENAQRSIYGVGADSALKLHLRRIERYGQQEDDKDDADDLQTDPNQPSVARLVNELIAQAIDLHATDIHIEPFEKHLRIRFRIDGMLRTIPEPAELCELSDAIAARIKVMGQLNIAEKRIPQDGRILFNHRGKVLNLRLSVLPSPYGETICLRILSSDNLNLELSQLGLNPQHLAQLHALTNRTSGLILVTGPTGSGKTTTLYSVLSHIKANHPELKIITVEDPIEYEIDGLTQIQTHSDIGLNFSTVLRSILRHDPDIILIGEIRDSETAEIAIQAAMTGHLVFSTLHTNDSVGAVNRLINMGAESDLVASSLNCVIAQRLVRRLCTHCARKIAEADIPAEFREQIKQAAEDNGIDEPNVYAANPNGCDKCGHTGYSGRIAVYEFFQIDEAIEDSIAAHASDSALRKIARSTGMKNMREDAWLKVALGLTDSSEVLRAITFKW